MLYESKQSILFLPCLCRHIETAIEAVLSYNKPSQEVDSIPTPLAGEELWPDLILVDGGLGQLHAAQQAFQQMNAPMPHLVSIAKKQEKIFLHPTNKPLKLPANSPAKKLLQYVRDEAHRFAQHYHHILRNKKMLNKK